MIAISSHRPHSKSVEFRRNQLLAKRTWDGFFTKIIYAGTEEPELHSQKTVFMAAEEWPTIQTLAKIASDQPAPEIAILNADILIGHRFFIVMGRMQMSLCASSRRYHFDTNGLPKSLETASLIETDRGRDIFIAKKRIWKRIADAVPPHLRIGHQQWDAWMTDYFNDHCKPGFFDFTGMKCIFHPNHEDRQMPYADQVVKGMAVA